MQQKATNITWSGAIASGLVLLAALSTVCAAHSVAASTTGVRRSLTPRSATLRNGVILQYVEQGDRAGLPVVFLHGVTDSWKSFDGVLANLPPSVRAFAVTQRGHGESSKPAAGYRFTDLAADVNQFLDAVDVRAAVIVGHSMGSGVAQRFALDFPERTRGIVLMGSFPTLRGNPVIDEFWSTTLATLTDPIDRAIAEDFQKSTLAHPIDPAALDVFVDESLKAPSRVWRATFSDFRESDFSKQLNRITAPTLIVWGDKDAIVPRREDQEYLRDSIRGSRLVIYPDAGHAFHWEDPARFARDLMAFISGTTKGSTTHRGGR